MIGFRAESDYTGKSIDRLMEEYLLSQQSAGIISSAEQEEILRRWTNHEEWSY